MTNEPIPFWVGRLKAATSDQEKLEAANELFRSAIRATAVVRTRGAPPVSPGGVNQAPPFLGEAVPVAPSAAPLLVPTAQDVQAIISALAGSSPQARRATVQALGECASQEAAAPLAKLLGDPDEGVRRAVVAALAKIGGPEAIEALCQAAEKDGSEAVRYDAVSALVAAALPSAHPARAAVRTRGAFLGGSGPASGAPLGAAVLDRVRQALSRIAGAHQEQPHIRGLARAL